MVTRRQRPHRRARVAIVALAGLALLGGVVAVAASGDGNGAGSGGAATDEAAGSDEGSFGQGDVLPGSLAVEEFDGGGSVTLADFRGQPLVLNFFASWCPPCVQEMPDIESVHQEFAGEVAFLGAAMQDVTREAALDVVDRTGVTYDVTWDPEGELFRAFGGFNMPTTVFIDADGRFVERHNGILTLEQLRAAVENLKA